MGDNGVTWASSERLDPGDLIEALSGVLIEATKDMLQRALRFEREAREVMDSDPSIANMAHWWLAREEVIDAGRYLERLTDTFEEEE